MTDRTLSDIMEFDHVIQVNADGSIADALDGIYAPELFWVDGDTTHTMVEQADLDWFLLDGFSGQDRYAGPIMHPSEYIGGSMERYIREHPGLYVALVCEVIGDDPDEDLEPAGWAVAYIDQDDLPLVCDTCGTVGSTDDAIQLSGPCQWEHCNGTIQIGEIT